MWKYLKKYWWAALLAPLFMVGEAGMDLLQPILMARIVDDGVLGLNNAGVGDMHLIIITGVQMIATVALGGMCGVLCGVFANVAAQNFGNDVRKSVFQKIMSLSFGQTDQFTTGSLITRVTSDITQIQNMVQMFIRGFIRTFILFAGGIICMLSLDLSFGAVVACALPLVVIIVVYFLSKVNPKFSLLQERLDKVNNVMQENVAGSRVVKAYVREDYEKGRFGKANNELVGTQLDVLLLLSYMTPLMNVILNASVIAIIKVGGLRVEAGAVTPGNVMAAITYLSQILNAVMRLGMMFQSVARGRASEQRINEVLNCSIVISDGTFDEEPKVKGKVEFRNVSFRYPITLEAYGDEDGAKKTDGTGKPGETGGQNRKNIIEDLSLTINPGETIGILGETGCGKTSLVNLIPRFYDVTGGSVLLDDVDVRDYTLKNLRSRISTALQKSEIFHATIKENISWGRPEASDVEIQKAAEVAQADEFIKTKADGMDEMVAQSGHSLSGGQKQRVAISRAVLKNAEVLIFDDTTSALDLKTEANLYRALQKEYPDQTKIIIAQRIASVKDADRIAVLEEGKLAALGTHEELLQNSSIYQDIYNSQMKGGEE